MKNNKGITLIAAAVTVMLLIIIAGITINATIGDNGVLSRANKSKERSEFSEKYEAAQNAIARAYTYSGTTVIDANKLDGKFGDFKVKFVDADHGDKNYAEASEASELSNSSLPIYVVFEDNTKIYIDAKAEIDLNQSRTSSGSNAKDIME